MKRQNLRTVSLIVVTFTYLLFGAAIFGWLESDHETRQREALELIESIVRRKYNISEDDFTVLTTTVIKSVPHKAGIQWKFSGAFYFATTVVTTIGYGHSTPATVAGRTFCMVYALIGIPLGLVMFQSIGERLNTIVGSTLKYAKRCVKAKNPEVTQTNLVMVVSVLSTILMTSMAAVFAKYERWEYFDAFYYCFITLTTIGFGDYVALQKESALQSKPEYVALSLIFILFGLSVVSSAVNLLVLKFLTLNTEDERRDEQLRHTAALNPIQLEGDVITSAAGKLQYARAKQFPAGQLSPGPMQVTATGQLGPNWQPLPGQTKQQVGAPPASTTTGAASLRQRKRRQARRLELAETSGASCYASSPKSCKQTRPADSLQLALLSPAPPTFQLVPSSTISGQSLSAASLSPSSSSASSATSSASSSSSSSTSSSPSSLASNNGQALGASIGPADCGAFTHRKWRQQQASRSGRSQHLARCAANLSSSSTNPRICPSAAVEVSSCSMSTLLNSPAELQFVAAKRMGAHDNGLEVRSQEQQPAAAESRRRALNEQLSSRTLMQLAACRHCHQGQHEQQRHLRASKQSPCQQHLRPNSSSQTSSLEQFHQAFPHQHRAHLIDSRSVTRVRLPQHYCPTSGATLQPLVPDIEMEVQGEQVDSLSNSNQLNRLNHRPQSYLHQHYKHHKHKAKVSSDLQAASFIRRNSTKKRFATTTTLNRGNNTLWTQPVSCSCSWMSVAGESHSQARPFGGHFAFKQAAQPQNLSCLQLDAANLQHRAQFLSPQQEAAFIFPQTSASIQRRKQNESQELALTTTDKIDLKCSLSDDESELREASSSKARRDHNEAADDDHVGGRAEMRKAFDEGGQSANSLPVESIQGSALLEERNKRLFRSSSSLAKSSAIPKLVCKCCCQHAECIRHALETTSNEEEAANPIRQNDENANFVASHFEQARVASAAAAAQNGDEDSQEIDASQEKKAKS